MVTSFGVLGNGGQAREVVEYATPSRPSFHAISGGPPSPDGAGIVDILTKNESLIATPVVAAVGAPGLRRVLVEAWSGSSYHTVVAESAFVSRSAVVGAGCIIAPGSIITAGVRLEEHVLLNVGASISHETVVGAYATISPGVRIAGNCRIGVGVFLGIGAVVSHGVSIVEGAVIGAGSTVVDDIDVSGIWVGSPARIVKTHAEWMMHL